MSAWVVVVVVLFPALSGGAVVGLWWLAQRVLSHRFGHPEDWWCPLCRRFHPHRTRVCPRKED